MLTVGVLVRGVSFVLPVVLSVSLAACTMTRSTESMPLPTIAWETESLRRLSEPGDTNYNGYARLIQLADESLFLVYFNSGLGIVARRSRDAGETWEDGHTILPNSLSHNMDNPEVVQLQDGSLLVSTNLRPRGLAANRDQSRRFQIGVTRSSDGGETWSDLQIIYTASWEFANEAPYLARMPSGETILSYQSPVGRQKANDALQNAIPYVVIGDTRARNLRNATTPFDIPEGRHGLWNSVTALASGEIVALTSTNGLSPSGRNEVWMIKGVLERPAPSR